MPGPPGRFAAVVLAGDRRADDPVARAAGVPSKVLAAVGGTPMILRVLEALRASREVGERIVCGPARTLLDGHDGLRRCLESGEVRWVEPRATPSASAEAALSTVPEGVPVLLTTADHALLTAPIIDYFCTRASATAADTVVGLARHELVLPIAGGVRRTVVRLRDGGYCGCNLFAFVTPGGRRAAAYWRRVEHERKRPLRVALGALGWAAALRYALGQLSLEEGLRQASRRLGVRVGVVVLPFPHSAIDVDTPEDLRLARALADGPVA